MFALQSGTVQTKKGSVESIYMFLYPSTREHLAAKFTLKLFALFLTDIPLGVKYQRVFGHKFATMWTRHLKLNRSTPSCCEMTLQGHIPLVAFRALFSVFLLPLTREAWFAEIAVALRALLSLTHIPHLHCVFFCLHLERWLSNFPLSLNRISQLRQYSSWPLLQVS
jgi:hypothetical protein